MNLAADNGILKKIKKQYFHIKYILKISKGIEYI